MSELRQKIKALLLRELGEKVKSNSRGRALVVGGGKKRKSTSKGRKLRRAHSVDIMELMGKGRRSKSHSRGRALSARRRHKSRSKSHSRGRALSVHRRHKSRSKSHSRGRALYKKSYSAYNGLGSALLAGKRSKSRSKSRGRKANPALKMIVKIAKDLKKQDGGRREWKEYISMAGKEYRRERR
jgi:hypothetical protein